MTTKYLKKTNNIIIGITLKELNRPEKNNMALHVCENEQAILENRKALAAELNIPLTNFVCANQTHSANFFKVTKEYIGAGSTSNQTAILDTDALYTFEHNIALCSFTADCVPVLFYDEEKGLIGAIHSGWQGTIKGISTRLLTHLKSVEQCDLTKLHVEIGPALSQEKFEVDEDVYVKFKALGYADEYIYFNEKTNKYHIDNQKTVKKQFELAGVPTKNITIDPTCTFMDESGFSYRQDKKCGRHLSFIMQK